MLSSLERSKSTRRTATVTTSAPEASSARIISSVERYLPVPTSRREWNTRPPMVRGMSFTTSRAVVIGSPSSYEMHQLDGIARGDAHLAQRRPAHDAAAWFPPPPPPARGPSPPEPAQPPTPAHGVPPSPHPHLAPFA